MSVQTKVTLEGNFFRRDPGKTLRGNVRDMMDALAEWMEDEVKGAISAQAGSMPYWTGWTRDHVVGRTTSVRGKRWGTYAVVSANTEGMSDSDAKRTLAAAAGRQNPFPHGTAPGIESRWHPFRRVKSGVYRARPIITANLTKNLE